MLFYFIIICIGYSITLSGMQKENHEPKTLTLTFKLQEGINPAAVVATIKRIDQLRNNNPFIVNEKSASIDHEQRTITIKEVAPANEENLRKAIAGIVIIEENSIEEGSLDCWNPEGPLKWDPIELNPWSFGDGTPNNPYPYDPLQEIADLNNFD